MSRKTEETPADPRTTTPRRGTKADLTSQAWEATSHEEQAEAAGSGGDDLTREQQRVTPEEVRKHAIAQGTDKPSIPRGRNPDTAMCEDRDHPGRIDKENDC